MYKTEKEIEATKTSFNALCDLDLYSAEDLAKALSKKQCIVMLPAFYDLRKHNNKEFLSILCNFHFKAECNYDFNKMEYFDIHVISKDDLLESIERYQDSHEYDRSFQEVLQSMLSVIKSIGFEYFII